MEKGKVHTKNQVWAQRAFTCVCTRRGAEEHEYRRAARSLPMLIHTCGVAQAFAFARAKEHHALLEDLTAVLDNSLLEEEVRTAEVVRYLRLSRDALAAAGWLKRYAEALIKGDE